VAATLGLLSLGLFGRVAAAQAEPDDGYVVDVVEDAADARAASAWRTSLGTWRLRVRGDELSAGLVDVPGVQVRRLGGDGASTTVGLRGASAQQVLILLDGVPLNPTRGGGVDLALIPAALVDRVDVYRGGSGARFGSGALGGALDVILARPSGGMRASIHGGSGSFGTWRLGGGAAGPLGQGGLRGFASADALTTEGDFAFVDDQGERHVRVNADARRLGGVAGLTFERDGWRLALTSFTSAIDRGAPGPSEFQERLSEARRVEASTVTALTATRFALLETPALVLDGTLRAGHRWGLDRYRNPHRLLQSQVPFETDQHEQDGSAFGDLSAYTVGGHAAHLTVDGDFAHLTRVQRVALDATAEEVFTRTTVAPALSVDLAVAAGLRVLPALRAEWIDDVGGGAASRLSPSLGVLATPTDGVQLLANLARAWRAPSLDELYLRTEFVEGNPALVPEDAVSADLGVRWRHRRFALEAAVFRLDVQEQVLFLPVSSTIYRAQNTGPASVIGLETAGEVRVSRWFSLLGGYTYTRARFDSPPFDPLPARPAHQGFGEARVTAGPAELFGRVRGRSHITLDNFGNLSNPAVTTVDAGLALALGEDWSFSLSGRNLGDVQSAVDALQLPQPGRSFHAQITWVVDRAADEPRARLR